MAKVIVVGAGTMGGPLIQRLKDEGHTVASVVSRRRPSVDGVPWIAAPHGTSTVDDVAKALGQHGEQAEVAFLALPSDGVGDIELAYMRHFLARGTYVVTFAKSALAYHYDDLRDDLDLIGRSATVGGRTLILPWLKSQHLVGKTFTMFCVLNASSNFFMDDMCSNGNSPEEAYLSTKNNHLAEPGSSDFVGFLNGEIGGDIPQKITILMKDAVLRPDIEMTPRKFQYKALDKPDISELALPTKNYRYVVCISNTHKTPVFDSGKPGHLFAKVNGFTISGGFHDISGNTHLNNWLKGGKTNGVQIRFEGDYSVDGTVEVAGPGAGLGTVGAAMNDMYTLLEKRAMTLGDAVRDLPFKDVPKLELRGSSPRSELSANANMG